MRPEFVTTSTGQLQAWISDPPDGPTDPVIILPGLTSDGARQLRRFAAALPRRSCIAVSHPGTSSSSDVDHRADLAAAAVEEALTALGLERAPVVAVGLSAALLPHLDGRTRVTVDLAAARSMEGIQIDPDLFAPRADGTHLPALWTFLRDRLILVGEQSIPEPTRDELPTPAELDATFLAYAPQPEVFASWWNVCTTALRMIPESALTACPELAELDEMLPRTGRWIRPAPHQVREGGAHRDYFDSSHGRLHVRQTGSGGRPLLLCHSAPGSASNLEAMMGALSAARWVIAPDYLGNGESAKSGPEHPTIVDVAAPLVELFDSLAARSPDGTVDLWGTHTGALVALEIAIARPGAVGRMIMEAPPVLDPELSAEILKRYLPPIKHDRWGIHTLKAWNMRRDMFLFWPWYDDRVESSRSLGVPDTASLHNWTIGLLQSGTTFHRSYRAAFEYDTRTSLSSIPCPTLICAGPTDMLAEGLDEIADLAPAGTQVTATPATCWYPEQSPADFAETIRAYEEFFDRR